MSVLASGMISAQDQITLTIEETLISFSDPQKSTTSLPKASTKHCVLGYAYPIGDKFSEHLIGFASEACFMHKVQRSDARRKKLWHERQHQRLTPKNNDILHCL